MGLSLSCVEKVESLKRIEFDMSPLKVKKLPIVWLVGQQNTGKQTHGKYIQEKFDFEHISISQLLRNEATIDTERGNIIKECLKSKNNAPDKIVLDLLKEALLKSTNKRGFIISNFPKTSKQAEMFVKEIGNVNFILYLYSETPCLIERAQQKASGALDEEILKKNISFATRDIKAALVKFEVKVENINTSSPPEEVFENIETVLLDRLNIKRPTVETGSSLSVIAWANFPTVKDCAKFASQRNGLAFNFSPSEAAEYREKYVRNCQVLGCPEIGNSVTLVMDMDFDYYSAYGNWNTTENATCIRSVGLFKLTEEKQNYVDSIKKCQDIGADLAYVISELRTNQLSQYINSTIQEWYKAAYVGLDDMEEEGNFRTVSGMTIRCSRYRAWGPGHPRSKHRNEDCVILDSDKMWRVISCNIILQGLCEFYPEEPLEPANYKNVTCDYIFDEEKKKTCESNKALFELFNNSSRLDKCAIINYD